MSVAVQFLVDTEVSAPTANRRAVAELFAEHGRYVWRVLRHLGVRDRDTDDLCQEVFLIALRRIDSLHSETAARAWLYGIAIRVAAAYRNKAYHRRESLQEIDRESSSETDFAHETDVRRELTRVEKLLDSLPERHRAAFVLIELHGLSFKEVADALKCALPTAYSWHAKAREQLLGALRLEMNHE
jgi:RNA polymerase sigma-70 factor (ECF subfamily)